MKLPRLQSVTVLIPQKKRSAIRLLLEVISKNFHHHHPESKLPHHSDLFVNQNNLCVCITLLVWKILSTHGLIGIVTDRVKYKVDIVFILRPHIPDSALIIYLPLEVILA